jgi:hypothetical protein
MSGGGTSGIEIILGANSAAPITEVIVSVKLLGLKIGTILKGAGYTLIGILYI